MTEIKEGYKDSEIGVIPEGWGVVKLESLGKIITGSTPKTLNQDFYINGTRLWASPSDLGKSKEIKTTNTKLSDLGFEQIRVLEKRSILITCIGSTIGKMGIAYEEMSSNQQINAITCNEKNNPDFYYYVLFKIKDKIQKLAGTQAVPLLNKTDFSLIKVIQPPLKEQEKIADILGASDEKIDAIEQQIQKAQTLKIGLLQKLLSEGIGHSEFKDSELGKIPESWEVVELGSFSKSISKKNIDNKITDVVSVTKYNGIVNSLEYFNKKVFSDNITTYKIIERNQFAYATIHLDEGSIGFLDIFDIAVLSPMYSVFEIDYKRVDRSYFYSLVKSHKMIKIYEHIGLGSVERRKSISFNIFNKIKIPLPPLKEQKQIADILSTADEKLEVLRAKKQKYETLKIGLLQKLLSGEVRV